MATAGAGSVHSTSSKSSSPDFRGGELDAVRYGDQEVRVMPYAGGCSCGAVHYELTAEPIRGFQCQWRHCQRATGSGHASVMVFPRAALRITGPVSDISRTADTGAQKLTGFCGP